MKKKALNKKLSLNKVTVSLLTDQEMIKVNGGLQETKNCPIDNEPGPVDPPSPSKGVGFSCIWPSCIG